MFNIPNNTKPSLNLNPTNLNNNEFNNQNFQQPVNNQNNYGGINQQANFDTTQIQNSQNNNYGSNANGSSQGGVILAKGQKVSLSKFNSALDEIDVCLGWDVSAQNYDLDSEAFLLGPNDKVIGDEWFVFYNQPCSPDGSVRHSGDNKTGEGFGDDEIINIKLSRVNPSVSKIVFVVTINEAKQRNLNFAGVANAFIRVVDKNQNRELVRFNLTEYYSNVTSMMVGEIYKKNNEWRFNPIGNGTDDDLFGLCRRYGVNVAG